VCASVGYKLPINFGYTSIDAVKDGVTYFKSSGTGASIGSSYGVFTFIGTWYSYRLNNNSINPIPAYYESLKETVEDFGRKIVEGIENIYGIPR
jgi:hypothetical protein